MGAMWHAPYNPLRVHVLTQSILLHQSDLYFGAKVCSTLVHGPFRVLPLAAGEIGTGVWVQYLKDASGSGQVLLKQKMPLHLMKGWFMVQENAESVGGGGGAG